MAEIYLRRRHIENQGKVENGHRHLWRAGADVSHAELAIDFEIATGLDLPGLDPTKAHIPLNERARMISKMLKALEIACKAANIGRPTLGKQAGVLPYLGWRKGTMWIKLPPELLGKRRDNEGV